MTQDKRNIFNNLFYQLVAQFPQWRPTKMTNEAYWQALKDFETEDHSAAFGQFHMSTHEFPPNASQIVMECRRAKGKRHAGVERAKDAARNEAEMSTATNHAPKDPAAQKAYIDDSANAECVKIGYCNVEWERMARGFECESQTLGIRPWETTPQDVAKRRIAMLIGGITSAWANSKGLVRVKSRDEQRAIAEYREPIIKEMRLEHELRGER